MEKAINDAVETVEQIEGNDASDEVFQTREILNQILDVYRRADNDDVEIPVLRFRESSFQRYTREVTEQLKKRAHSKVASHQRGNFTWDIAPTPEDVSTPSGEPERNTGFDDSVIASILATEMPRIDLRTPNVERKKETHSETNMEYLPSKEKPVCKTHPGYWDCECNENYIHSKMLGNYCPMCKKFAEEQPDSFLYEVELLYIQNQDTAKRKEYIHSNKVKGMS